MKSCRFGAAFAAISWSTRPAITSSISAADSVCISKNAPSPIASGMYSGLVLADQLLDAAVRDHDLDRGDPAAADLRQQALGDDAAKHAGEDRPHLRLLDRGEELDIPADRLGGVDRVHRREDEVPGLGCLQRRLGRLGVAQLADQDHVGVLPQRAAERLVERLGVETRPRAG